MKEQTVKAICGIRIMVEHIDRGGIEDLLTFIETGSDFFTAPASTRFHLAYEGGLAEHSWNVTDLLFKKNERHNTLYDFSTLAIVGLFHDICKTNMYKLVAEDPTDAQLKYLSSLCKGRLPKVPGKLHKAYVSDLINFYVKGGKEPEYTAGSYQIEDTFPLGHGEKSVIILQKFIELTDEEIYAIRWHMCAWDISPYSTYAYNEAVKKSRLVTLVTTADMEATNILEVL